MLSTEVIFPHLSPKSRAKMVQDAKVTKATELKRTVERVEKGIERSDVEHDDEATWGRFANGNLMLEKMMFDEMDEDDKLDAAERFGPIPQNRVLKHVDEVEQMEQVEDVKEEVVSTPRKRKYPTRRVVKDEDFDEEEMTTQHESEEEEVKKPAKRVKRVQSTTPVKKKGVARPIKKVVKPQY